jgi:hypothetical protein
MLTDNFWKRRFHGDREIIGRFGYRRAAPQNSIRWWRYAMSDAIYDLRFTICDFQTVAVLLEPVDRFLQRLCEIEPLASATSDPAERIAGDANRRSFLHIASICSLQIRQNPL